MCFTNLVTASTERFIDRVNQLGQHGSEMELELVRLRPLQQEYGFTSLWGSVIVTQRLVYHRKLQLQTEVADLTRRLGEETASRNRFVGNNPLDFA